MSVTRRHAIILVGLALVVIGVGPAAWSIAVAYAPFTSTSFTTGIDVGLIGSIAVLVGTLLISGWLGHHVANRTTRGIRRAWPLAAGVLLIAGMALLPQPNEPGATEVLVASPVQQIPLLPWSIVLPLVEHRLVLLAGLGCLAWWVGAQLARRRGVNPR